MFAINPQLGNWGQGILGKQILSSRNMWFLLEKIKFWLITLKNCHILYQKRKTIDYKRRFFCTIIMNSTYRQSV